MADRVCEWITITAQHDIHETSTPNGQAWVEILRALWARHDCEGYERTYWGRVLEERDKLWIWTSWETKQTYDSHKNTDQYRSLHNLLALLSNTLPSTSLLQFDHKWSYNKHLRSSWPSITMAYFTHPIPEDQRTRIRNIRGMWPSRRLLGDLAVYGGPARGFLLPSADNVVPTSGAPAEVYIFLDYWESPIREEEVRGPEELIDMQPGPPPLGDLKRLSTLFEEELREAGCVEKVVRHARFNALLEIRSPHEQAKGKSTEYDWETGRRERRERVRKIYGDEEDEEDEEFLQGLTISS
ncbi:hypothetical protein K469DRAFT_751215 [Zopfia rhizophila CBS 207.26]|uniref:ABM domain-containing protein n=1 Tax=Zopfia rhizophila CBS 207.26 TaxID=1314779 RepID=A0A6A6DZY9_9PEZI|nr:hypothetical protein K469DRAFT_751215 [Zopfia rhizophila CBS 207.26]